MRKEKNSVICPSCGKKGFLTKRWVESQYYPQFGSLDVDRLEDLKGRVKKYPDNILLQTRLKRLEKKVKGNKYLGEKKKFLINPEEEHIDDNKDWYRVTYKRYFYYYICHYDKQLYAKNMERYRNGELKSRPNGRISHKLRENDYEDTYDKYGNKKIIVRKGTRNK